jgi:hypothetical protein
MGYQLWTSPVTGYRRRGTRLSDFQAELGAKITGHAIFEPLLSCPSDAPASDMRGELKRRDFDVAGVRRSITDPVIGFVRRENLHSGLVMDHIEAISKDAIVDESIGIDPLLTLLRARAFVFVTVNNVLVGIITLADFNKPLVRTYFFGLLSLLEIHLSFWVAQQYRDDTWKDMLTPARLQQATDVQAERERRRQKLALVDCLQFSDKGELVIAHDHLRKSLGFGSKAKAKRYLSRAEKLRNTLAHSQYYLAQEGAWTELIDLVQWVEAVIATSDASVERHASDMAQGYFEALW